MPVFEHVSRYPRPRDEVFAWHTRPGAFVRLTPPGMAVVTSGPTNGIAVGSEIVLRVSHPVVSGFLPVGVPWRVRHVEFVAGERFVDEQVSGPFRYWRHEHVFTDGPEGSTVLTDRVTWELPLRLPVGLDRAVVEGQLTGLFRFRERQLRDDLLLHARLAAAPGHVVVTGASGLVGRQVCALLTTGGHRVTRLVRRRPGPGEARWDPASGQVDPALLKDADAVVHLAGEPIGGRFTARHKDAVLRSRLDGTRTIARALASGGPRTLVQASAIGIYGPRRPGELLTEESPAGSGFLAEVVTAWEAAAQPAVDAGVRTVFLRTGIALSGGGGALLPQLPLFLAGAGGRLTAPDAWMSWIGLDDLARAYVHAVFTPGLSGAVNAVAPHPVTSGVFARTLGRVLRRPALLPTPGFGPALVLGPEGRDQMVDIDQRVSCGRLVGSGFEFAQPTLTDALAHALLKS